MSMLPGNSFCGSFMPTIGSTALIKILFWIQIEYFERGLQTRKIADRNLADAAAISQRSLLRICRYLFVWSHLETLVDKSAL